MSANEGLGRHFRLRHSLLSSSEFDTLDYWILAAIARSYHRQYGWSLLEPSLGDTQLLPFCFVLTTIA
jgi:hypothetical protein